MSNWFRSSVFVLLCVVNCACGDPPTGPTPIPDQASSADSASKPANPPSAAVPPPNNSSTPSYGAGSTSATRLCANIKQGVSCLVLAYDDRGATVKVTNSGTTGQLVNASVYRVYGDGFNQRICDSCSQNEVKLAPGQSVTLKMTRPDNPGSSGTCAAQYDVYIGAKVNSPPHSDATLLGYERSGGGFCSDPTPPAPGPKPGPGPNPPPGPSPNPNPGPGPTPEPNPGPSDQCPNLDGVQTSIPPGLHKSADGQCLPDEAQPPTPPTDPPCPPGQVRNPQGVCEQTPPPPPGPQCDPGQVVVDGKCVDPEPPPPNPVPTGSEGCSHGYWKTHPGSWPSPYAPDYPVRKVFSAAPAGVSFQDALEYNGGDKAMILLRNAVGSALNIAHSVVDFPLTMSELVSKVNAALSGSNADKTALNEELDNYNNLGCPLSR